MILKSPVLASGKADNTGLMEDKVLSRQKAEARQKAVVDLYEFLQTKLGYSESLARAASGYVPPLD